MCKLISFLAIVLAMLCYQTNAQILFQRPCREIAPMTNFNASQFAGTWIEESRYDYQPFEGTQTRCAEAVFTPIAGAAYPSFNVNYSMLINNTLTSRGIIATMDNLIGESTIYLDLDNTFNLTIQVITTDYTTHSILWGCIDVPATLLAPSSNEYLWVLTREREPSEQINFVLDRFVRTFFEPNNLTIQNTVQCGAAQIYAGILFALIMATIVQFIK